MKHVAVVGSGPAGLWCAKALLARGVRVTVLDVGERLPAALAETARSLAALPLADWPADAVERIAADDTAGGRAIPRKLVLGSDYLYGGSRAFAPQEGENDGAQPTYALGGYTVAWGAAMLPFHADDMTGWPFGPPALRPHYETVARALPLTGAADGLQAAFPSHRPAFDPAPPPPAAAALLHRLERARGLRAAGAIFGQARLAVDTGRSPQGCRRCGLCLTGCPVGAVYGTGPEMLALAAAGKLAYRDRVLLRRVREDAAGVEAELLQLDGGGLLHERFDAVFLGAGAVGTTRILLRSAGHYGRPVGLLEAPKFLLPMLALRAPLRRPEERESEFAAAFLELRDDALSPHWVHAQLSAINRLALSRLGIRAGGGWRKRLAGRLACHLLFAWGGVHSAHSPDIALRLERRGEDDILDVASAPGTDTRGAIRRAARRLARLAPRFGALAPAFLVRTHSFGTSAHVGGTFPMRRTPDGPFASDELGRPAGYRRVHIVDAAAFPSVPATTVAFSIMANAHRIGSAAPLQ